MTEATITIKDNDVPGMSLSASPARVAENAGATKVTVTASTGGVTFKAARTVAVTVGKSGDTATSGTDYAAVTGFDVTITAGQTSGTGTFTLTPTNDALIEGDETITVAGTTTGYTVTGTSVTLDDDDDTEITLTAKPASVGEGAGATDVTVTAATDGGKFAQDRKVTVTVGASGDTATSGTDYAKVTGFEVTIAAGKTSGTGTFTLTPTDDTEIEGKEAITVAGTSAPLTVNGTSVTLTDDDSTGLTLDVRIPKSVGEDAGATKVTVTASTDGDTFKTARTVTVTVGASDDSDSATSGTDYAAVERLHASRSPREQTSGKGTFTLTPTARQDRWSATRRSPWRAPPPALTVTGTSMTLTSDDDHPVSDAEGKPGERGGGPPERRR